MVMKRVLLVLLGCAACATVADIEVNRSGEPSDQRDRDGVSVEGEGGALQTFDGASDAPATADTGGPVQACGCDAGSACCIRASSNPACDVPSCTEPGSLVVGCVRAGADGRDCCWRPDGGLAHASFGPGCANDTAACQSDADCAAFGGKCTTLACKGVALGVCAASAPPWFVCPP